MRAINDRMARGWLRIGTRFLPFADAATEGLPLSRLLRLSLFQVSVGMATVLMIGTLNRVMIVELGVGAWLVAVAVALPMMFAPFRTIIGFRSDHHVSALGWRRVPYIWMGTMLQFGGLAIMPFALILLSGDTQGPEWVGHVAAALAFLLVGAGLQTTQTAGLALATDLAPESARPRVVALMYVMLLVGMVGSGLVFGILLHDFSQIRLIQVIQGAAAVTMVLNVIALWKQEARDPSRNRNAERPEFKASFMSFASQPRARRFLAAIGLGTAAFNMQDIIIEPYGGEVLHLSVSQTTSLTAILAGGSFVAYGLAARALGRGVDPYRLAGYGVACGLPAFALVMFSGPAGSPLIFQLGAALIGFGSGLFAVGTLIAAMALDENSGNGLALGAWGAVQALAVGLSMSAGGILSDVIGGLAAKGRLGPALVDPWSGYNAVYQIEIILLFATLIVIGPLARHARSTKTATKPQFGLAGLRS
ncbi:MAG: PucC family protein [Beijerinckiaceae bacterium]|nr:PucC family protein [Beijerinckiaceae bacterium]